MQTFYLELSLAFAIADWVAVAKAWKPVEYIAKPAVMLALLAWFGGAGGFRGHAIWFAVGLVFSLAGDVFLMLPREQFIPGLVAFLMAHLAYLTGFNAALPPINAASLILALIVFATTIRLYTAIAGGLEARRQNRLKFPVLAYSAVISLMLLSALLTLVRPDWSAVSAGLASGGALLFFLSDTCLSWNKFVHPFAQARLVVMITYHLGQIFIILSAVTHSIK